MVVIWSNYGAWILKTYILFSAFSFTKESWKTEPQLQSELWLYQKNVRLKTLKLSWIHSQSFTILTWLCCWVTALTVVDKMILVVADFFLYTNTSLVGITVPIYQVCSHSQELELRSTLEMKY